jgi:hypothetical protein
MPGSRLARLKPLPADNMVFTMVEYLLVHMRLSPMLPEAETPRQPGDLNGRPYRRSFGSALAIASRTTFISSSRSE